MTRAKFLTQFCFAALAVAILVVSFGAFVRLTDAGLGCPDWPKCFGEWQVPKQVPYQMDDGEVGMYQVDQKKAWFEMIHRYLAGFLGMMILVIFLLSWLQPQRRVSSGLLATGLLLLLGVQAWLGMLTVTLQLYPLVVTGHLLGGMLILAMLRWLMLHVSPAFAYPSALPLGWRLLALLALFGLLAQILLGGWVSTHYAALACPDFPRCHGKWWPEFDWRGAFSINYEARNYEGGVLPQSQRIAIHFLHRLNAVIVSILLIALSFRAMAQTQLPFLKRLGQGLLMLLAVHLGMAVLMVHRFVPIHMAVTHNFLAALLWIWVVTITFVIWRRSA